MGRKMCEGLEKKKKKVVEEKFQKNLKIEILFLNTRDEVWTVGENGGRQRGDRSRWVGVPVDLNLKFVE